jgi:thymidylate kinase
VIFVSFSGIDGAGKSTQIKNLQARFASAGAAVVLLTFWDDVATLRNLRERMSFFFFKGHAGVGSPEKPINRRDKNVSSWPLILVRLVICLLDAIHLRWVARRALQSGADVVIFDRYIYDELANLPLERPFVRAYIGALLALVPRPQVAFLLDADPAAARLRKPEYPLEFLSKNRQRYLALAAIASEFAVVHPLQPLEVEQRVLDAMADQLPSDALRYLSLSRG